MSLKITITASGEKAEKAIKEFAKRHGLKVEEVKPRKKKKSRKAPSHLNAEKQGA